MSSNEIKVRDIKSLSTITSLENSDYLLASKSSGGLKKVSVSQLNNVIKQTTFTEVTLSSSSWSEGAYSLENNYPNATYDIEVSLSNNATVEEISAFGNAMIVGSVSGNILYAKGTVPEIDIHVIVKAVTK